MKKFTLSILTLLSVGAFALGSTFSACSSSNSNPTGVAGTSGGAGAAGSTAGTTGAAGNQDAGGDASYPVMASDGKCAPGAFSHDGKCSCQPDVPTVCKNGCTNVMTDDANCGSCDHACPATSTCNAGVCGPAATNLVPSAAGCTKTVGKAKLGISIAVANGTIYFADAGHGTVKSVPVAGGTVTTISSTEMAPHGIVANGTTALWINSVEGGAGDGGTNITATVRKSVAGAAPTNVVMATNVTGGINGLVLSTDGATLYYSSDVNIKSIPVAGGTSTDVALEEHGGIPGAIAIDGTKLVFPTDLNGDVDVITIAAGTVAKCGKNDASGELDPAAQINCLRIARSQGGLFLGAISARANRAYWINGTSLKANATGAGATQANEDIAQTDIEITALTTSTDKAYFGSDGIIDVAPLMPPAGAETKGKHIARGQPVPTSIAIDATKVYWATGAGATASAADCAINSTGL